MPSPLLRYLGMDSLTSFNGSSKERAKLLWEVMHWSALGLGELLPNPEDDDDWPGPIGPVVHDRIDFAMHAAEVNASILAKMLVFGGDPDPQPSFPIAIFDKEARLAGAKAAKARLAAAGKQLDGIIAGIS